MATSNSAEATCSWAVATTYREGAIAAIIKHAEDQGCLNALYTATPLGSLSRAARYVPKRYKRLRNLLGKRAFEFVPEQRVHHTTTLSELAHVIIRKIAGHTLGISSRLMYWVKANFDQEVARQIRDDSNTGTLIGMWGSSADSFEAAGSKILKVLNYVNSRPVEHNRLLTKYAALQAGHAEMIPPSVAKRVEREMQLADLILVPSQFIASQMPEYKDKVRVIPYGVNPNIFTTHNNTSKTCASETVEVLFVGQISHRKGLSTLLNAARSLEKCTFTLIGPLVSRSALAGAPPNVEYKGHVDHRDVPRAISKADIFVLPSFEDSYGLVVLEAMACAKAVVVSSNCGAAEVITNGQDGLIFEAGNEAGLMACLNSLISDPVLRQTLGGNAQTLVKNSQTWETFARGVAAAISSAKAQK